MWTTSKNEEIQAQVLKECLTVLAKKLDVLAIIPHLNNEQLLTPTDHQFLKSDAHDGEKAKYLIKILPKKDRGWFDKFLYCLHQSTYGTGHRIIIEKLEELSCSSLNECDKTHREL